MEKRRGWDKKGVQLITSTTIVFIALVILLVVIFAGPLKSNQNLSKDLGNKSAGFSDVFKSLEINKLLSRDREDLSDKEKEELAKDPNADAQSKINLARKKIDDMKYVEAIYILESAKRNLDPKKDASLLEEINSLLQKATELEKQRPWEDELNELKKLYNLYSGKNNKEGLLEVRDKIVSFIVGKYGRSRDLAGSLLEEVNLELQGLGVEMGIDGNNILEEYTLLLEHGIPSSEDPRIYYLDLARNFVLKENRNSDAIFDLFKRSELAATDTYTMSISIKELADYFYSIESLKGNSAYEYGRLIENLELKSALSSDSLQSVLHNRGVLIDEGYLPVVKWDIILSPTLVYDPGVWDSEKTIQVNFPLSFLSNLNEGADVNKFNTLYQGNVQLLTNENSNAYFSVDYPHNVGSYIPYFAQTTLGKNFERFDKQKQFPMVVRFWDKNDLFLGECLNYLEGSTAPSISYYLNEYNTNGGHIVLPRNHLECSTASNDKGGKAPSADIVRLVLEKYDSLENSERLVFKLDFLRPFQKVEEYSFSR